MLFLISAILEKENRQKYWVQLAAETVEYSCYSYISNHENQDAHGWFIRECHSWVVEESI